MGVGKADVQNAAGRTLSLCDCRLREFGDAAGLNGRGGGGFWVLMEWATGGKKMFLELGG